MSQLPDPAEVQAFRAASGRVRARIAAAAERAGRDPAAVTLVAVSKTVPAGRLAAALAADITLLGENRVQEAEAKAPQLPGARWHLVGHLQRNKAAHAVQLFDVLESVDSLELAQRLDRFAALPERWSRAGRLGVYLQVNVDRDPAKAGFDAEGLERALPGLVALEHLELCGLMTVGRLVEDAEEARPTFVHLRELSARLRATNPGLGAGLSMGMSDDFEVAVEEGATLVRIGRAIFGPRPPA